MAVPDDLPNVTGSTDDVILTCDSGTVASRHARDLKVRRGMTGSLSGGLATTAAPSTLARASKLSDLARGGQRRAAPGLDLGVRLLELGRRPACVARRSLGSAAAGLLLGAHVWVHEGGGWRMREGYWARR